LFIWTVFSIKRVPCLTDQRDALNGDSA